MWSGHHYLRVSHHGRGSHDGLVGVILRDVRSVRDIGKLYLGGFSLKSSPSADGNHYANKRHDKEARTDNWGSQNASRAHLARANARSDAITCFSRASTDLAVESARSVGRRSGTLGWATFWAWGRRSRDVRRRSTSSSKFSSSYGSQVTLAEFTVGITNSQGDCNHTMRRLRDCAEEYTISTLGYRKLRAILLGVNEPLLQESRVCIGAFKNLADFQGECGSSLCV